MKLINSAELETSASGPACGSKRGKMILLVEDESVVRRLARKALHGLGYQVVEAETGAEALRVWDEQRGGIDLLLTDLVMPDGLSGRALAERLLAKKPELQVIYASGYSQNWNGARFEEGQNFLQKPYDPEQLAAIVSLRLNQG